MAFITLNDLYDKWKKVSDWVTGVDVVSAPGVKLTGRKVSQEHKSFDAQATALVNPVSLLLNGEDKILLTTTGTATSFQLYFRAKGPSGVNAYVLGKKISDFAGTIVTAAQATAMNEVWEIEGLAGYSEFVPWLQSVTGGNITVTLKAVV